MSDDIQLNVNVEIAAAALEHFHDQKGGNRLHPQLNFDSKQSHLKKFTIHDEEAEASISFRPLQSDRSVMTVNVNAIDLWGWQLGVPGRSELGVTTYLGAETSPKCEQFCDDFVEHLYSIGYVVNDSTNAGQSVSKRKPGRPPYLGYDWAMKEIYTNNRDFKKVYLEWLEKFPKERKQQDDSFECFRKGIENRRKKLSES